MSHTRPNTINIELDDNQYLSDHPDFHQFPSGEIDKSDTNIGATHAELNAKRHSILVFPSRSIAYNKYLQARDRYFFVGSISNGVPVTKVDIQNYHNDPQIQYKKFLVVANSLHKVMRAIGLDRAYKDYFFFFDEIDKFQEESSFRSELEECIDYFLDPRCNGCIISATLSAFSNPELKALQVSIIKRKKTVKKNIDLYRIGSERENVLKLLVKRIEQYPNDKFLIAHKSTKRVLYYVNHLDITKRQDVKILCGMGSKEVVGDYYGNLESDKLPSRICFMTAAYFSGVDIRDNYHLIIISDNSTEFSLLTTSEIRQITGRCRNTLLTTSLVVPNHKIKINVVSKTDLLNAGKRYAKSVNNTEQTAYKIGIDSDSIKEHSIAVKAAKKHGVILIRRGLDLKYKISTFTIDQYINRQSQLINLYSHSGRRTQELSQYFQVSNGKRDFLWTDPIMKIKQTFFWLVEKDASQMSEARNRIEEKIAKRIMICQDGLFTGSLEWIIKDEFWESSSFRKEYIKKYIQHLRNDSSIWKDVRSKFDIGSFHNRSSMKNALSDIIDQLRENVELTSKDYLAVMKGFLITKPTTKNKVNGYWILGYQNSKSISFEITGYRTITFHGV